MRTLPIIDDHTMRIVIRAQTVDVPMTIPRNANHSCFRIPDVGRPKKGPSSQVSLILQIVGIKPYEPTIHSAPQDRVLVLLGRTH